MVIGLIALVKLRIAYKMPMKRVKYRLDAKDFRKKR